MRLLLINPRNPLITMANKTNYWNRYRLWKPLGLLVVAGLTPRHWDIQVVDENIDIPDYVSLPRPDVVGLTSFTSQAPRAYELASLFRTWGVPVVMGGIHATMCREEAHSRVDSVVTGEAESVWQQVLDDVEHQCLQPLYAGGHAPMDQTPIARHDLLPTGYEFGAVQTTRGCPLNCVFCSVSAFNGRAYRHRSIAAVIEEMQQIREKRILIVDDNLIGTRRDHMARAKDLFRAMIDSRLNKQWVCQATINMADDAELLRLARRAGCIGAFIGFESTDEAGLVEIHKKFNIQKGRDFADSVRRIQQQRISVAGSFIMGLDVDEPGIGRQIAETADRYGVDILNVMFLTPLPGTDLWEKMQREDRIDAHHFPADWQYYTLTLPVGRYRNFSRNAILEEMAVCTREFYSLPRILRRAWRNLRLRQRPLVTLIANLSYRKNGRLNRDIYARFCRSLEFA